MEIDDAFRRNLECPWVTQLHNLVSLKRDTRLFAAHPKYAERRLEERSLHLSLMPSSMEMNSLRASVSA